MLVGASLHGHRLLEHMLAFLVRQSAEQGMLGLYAEAVTVHVFSQKSNLALGGFETGVQLADEAPTVVFKQIDDGAARAAPAPDRLDQPRPAAVSSRRAGSSSGLMCYPSLMPSRASKRPKHRDINRNAFLTVMQATGSLPPPEPDTRNPAAVALGKLGAAKGGRARAEKLSATKRRAIAKKAARARWG